MAPAAPVLCYDTLVRLAAQPLPVFDDGAPPFTPEPVTGLASPALFLDRCEQLLARRTLPAFALVALLPSPSGSSVQLLWDVDARSVATVARALGDALRPSDLYTYAASGVFLVLLGDAVATAEIGEMAAALVERLRAARLSVAGGSRLQLNAGVATSATGARALTPARVIAAAMQALQQSCRAGVNQVRCIALHHAPSLQPRSAAAERERLAA